MLSSVLRSRLNFSHYNTTKSPIAIPIFDISPSTYNSNYDFSNTHSTPDIRAVCAACGIPALALHKPLVAFAPSPATTIDEPTIKPTH